MGPHALPEAACAAKGGHEPRDWFFFARVCAFADDHGDGVVSGRGHETTGPKGLLLSFFFFAGLAGSVRDTVPDPAGPEVPVEPHKGITGALSFRVYGRATFRTGVGEKRLSCGFSSLEISAKFANRIRETHPAVTQGCGSTILKKGYALWLESSMVVEHC